MKKDDPVTSFCKATSACREAGLYFLEGFNWNLDDAISGFLRDQLPPLKKPLPPSSPPPWTVNNQRSRSPSRRRYSTSTSVLKSKCKMDQDEISITWGSYTALTTKCLDASRELHGSHGEEIVSMTDPGSSVRATKISESTSTEIDLPFSDSDSGSD